MNETTDRRPTEAAMTRLTGRALRLTVFIGEHDQWHHKPLYAEIVHRAHAAGLAGASVFRGIEGFGASSLIHTSRLLSLSEDLPVAVVLVDTEERIRAFLPQLDELVTEGLVTLDPCEVIRYAGRHGAPPTADGKGENSL
jgi:PII-like signaling protein